MLKTVHKHQQLSELLREEIATGDFPGQRFHTVKHLMGRYEVSQATLTRALQPLFDEGLLYSVSGKGTFIRQGESVPVGDTVVRSITRPVYCIVSQQEIFDPVRNRDNWFTPQQILRGICDKGRDLSYHVHVTPMEPSLALFKEQAAQPNAGFIFLEYNVYEQLIEYCVKQGLPFAVFAKHHALTRNLNHIWLNVELAQYTIVRYLIERGHKRIGFFGDHKDSHRLRGYRAALRSAGLRFSMDLCRFATTGSIDDLRQVAAELLAANPDLDAIACANDRRAMGAIEAVQEAGRSVPEFGVTGIDNAVHHAENVPMVTTMDLSLHEAGAELLRLMDGAMQGKPAESIEIKPTFVQGKTA